MELWKPIEDWPYEVSNLGRVRRSGAAFGATVGRILKITINDGGYPTVHLRAAGRRQQKLLSRLVCRAFNGPPPAEDYHADHIDTVPENCRWDNLQWLTPADNLARVHHHRGEAHANSKLTEMDVIAIRSAPAKHVADLRNRLGISNGTFHAIRCGKAWKHAPLFKLNGEPPHVQ